MKWWDWHSGILRCQGSWIEPGRTFQCEQNQGHEGNHCYRDWQWTGEYDKHDPWGNGKRRKEKAS
jgi:hypothetical protein